MKKSAELIHKKIQNSSIQVLPNMYHGEFSINHADDYVRRLIRNNRTKINPDLTIYILYYKKRLVYMISRFPYLEMQSETYHNQ